MMRIDRNGAALSASYEAIYLYSYPDPATGGDPITSGVGHTRAAGGFAPRLGQIFTMRQVVDQYRQDMGRVEDRVNGAIHVAMKQHEFNVWCSFDLNTGAIISGSIDNLLNAGEKDAATAKLGQYIRAAGKVNRGLQNRRASEQAILRTGQYPAMKIAVRDRPGAAVRYINPEALPWDVEPLLEVELTVKPLAPVAPVVVPSKAAPVTRPNFIIDIAKALWNWTRK